MFGLLKTARYDDKSNPSGVKRRPWNLMNLDGELMEAIRPYQNG